MRFLSSTAPDRRAAMSRAAMGCGTAGTPPRGRHANSDGSGPVRTMLSSIHRRPCQRGPVVATSSGSWRSTQGTRCPRGRGVTPSGREWPPAAQQFPNSHTSGRHSARSWPSSGFDGCAMPLWTARPCVDRPCADRRCRPRRSHAGSCSIRRPISLLNVLVMGNRQENGPESGSAEYRRHGPAARRGVAPARGAGSGFGRCSRAAALVLTSRPGQRPPPPPRRI
jgi:hypothetical protein